MERIVRRIFSLSDYRITIEFFKDERQGNNTFGHLLLRDGRSELLVSSMN